MRYVVVIALACLPGMAAGQMYRCTVDGRTTFSDTPCSKSPEVVNVFPATGGDDPAAAAMARERVRQAEVQQTAEDVERERRNDAQRAAMARETKAKEDKCREIERLHAESVYWSREFKHQDNISREQRKAAAASDAAWSECGRILRPTR